MIILYFGEANTAVNGASILKSSLIAEFLHPSVIQSDAMLSNSDCSMQGCKYFMSIIGHHVSPISLAIGPTHLFTYFEGQAGQLCWPGYLRPFCAVEMTKDIDNLPKIKRHTNFTML